MKSKDERGEEGSEGECKLTSKKLFIASYFLDQSNPRHHTCSLNRLMIRGNFFSFYPCCFIRLVRGFLYDHGWDFQSKSLPLVELFGNLIPRIVHWFAGFFAFSLFAATVILASADGETGSLSKYASRWFLNELWIMDTKSIGFASILWQIWTLVIFPSVQFTFG